MYWRYYIFQLFFSFIIYITTGVTENLESSKIRLPNINLPGYKDSRRLNSLAFYLESRNQIYLRRSYHKIVPPKWNSRSHRRCFVKKRVLKNFINFKGKHLCWSFFLIKLQTLRCTTLSKRNSNTSVSCEICEIFKNTYFKENLPPAASNDKWQLLIQIFLLQINCHKSTVTNQLSFLALLIFLFVDFVQIDYLRIWYVKKMKSYFYLKTTE